jgi:hypothetical protein
MFTKHDETILGAVEDLEISLRAAQIYGYLKLAQKQKRLVSYLDLAVAFKLFSGGADLAKALGHLMEEAGDETEIYSAIVTRYQGGVILGPGAGFYAKAKSLGYDLGSANGDGGLNDSGEPVESDFWHTCLRHLGYDTNNLRML